MSTGAAGSLSAVLDGASRDVRRILTGILDGSELSPDDGITLTQAAGRDLHAVTLVADEMRRRQVGDVVTYVVNRNINFTNVCIKHCGFCAFSRDHREEEGYLLPVEEVVRRARGLHPGGAAAEARRALLHRPHARDQGRPARNPRARLLARGSALWIGEVGALDQGVPGRAPGCGARHAPRDVGRDPRPGDSRPDLTRPAHRGS